MQELPGTISWADFARGLGFSKADIFALSTNYSKVLEDKQTMTRRILEEWKCQLGKKVDIRDLTTYLENANFTDIANQVKKYYHSSVPDPV